MNKQEALSHFWAGAAAFGQSLWRSVVTVIGVCYATAPAGTFDNFHSALPWLNQKGLGIVIVTLIIPSAQAVKATAASVKGAPNGSN